MDGADGRTALRLVTFNTHHGVGDDGRHDLARIAALLHDTDADVICLQEVDRHFGDRSKTVDQAAVLAEGLGRSAAWSLAWGPAIDRDGPTRDAPRRQYGNAVLSRLPMVDDSVHRLPGDGEPRAAVRAVLGVGDRTLTVVATHLSSGSMRERAAQATALVDLLPGPGSASLVVGDLNATAGAPELVPLRTRLADAWQQAGSRGDQARGWQLWKRDQGLTHPARRPRVRIDQVWVSPEVRVTAARVLDGSACSDHHPLQVDLVVG